MTGNRVMVNWQNEAVECPATVTPIFVFSSLVLSWECFSECAYLAGTRIFLSLT